MHGANDFGGTVLSTLYSFIFFNHMCVLPLLGDNSKYKLLQRVVVHTFKSVDLSATHYLVINHVYFVSSSQINCSVIG